jgi:hypothetical protein
MKRRLGICNNLAIDLDLGSFDHLQVWMLCYKFNRFKPPTVVQCRRLRETFFILLKSPYIIVNNKRHRLDFNNHLRKSIQWGKSHT